MEIGKKKFQLHPWLAKHFGKKPEDAFFGIISIFILGALFYIYLPFFHHVLSMGSLIHLPKFRSLSQKL
jgi:hypothetical protein